MENPPEDVGIETRMPPLDHLMDIAVTVALKIPTDSNVKQQT